MKVFMDLQGSPAWQECRLGIATGSRMSEIITAKTEKPSASAEAYACELIAEVLTGGPDPWRWEGETVDMRRGTETEAQARAYFEIVNSVKVEQVGFCLHDNGRWGVSPDGLIGDSEGIELKCPAPKTQVKWLADGVLPPEHKAQCHGAMIVTGRDRWQFMSYCISLPPLCVTVERDAFTEKLHAELVKFNETYDRLMASIRHRLDDHILAEIDRRGSQLDGKKDAGIKAFINPSTQSVA